MEYHRNIGNQPLYLQQEQLQQIKKLYPTSRFLLACKNCYHLKPPVVVEVGDSSECPWCLGRDNIVLLFETKNEKGTIDDQSVEYAAIRERKSISDFSNKECENNLGLRWKNCSFGDECIFAHSRTERNLWQLESRYGIKWKQIADYYKHNQPKSRDTLSGAFHCFVCSKNFQTGKDFSAHCDTISHKRLIDSPNFSSLEWKHRPLPESDEGSFSLCSSVVGERCRYGDSCHYAHSEKELEEWNKRFRLQKEKLKVAKESGLISFADQIIKEYEETSSRAEIMKPSLSGVSVTTYKNLKQTIPHNQKQITWKLKIQCSDSTMKLNHAAFLPLPGHDNFTICRLRGGKRSDPTKHMDFTVMLDEDYSFNLHGGEVTFEIKFTCATYGTNRGQLVFEFRNQPRPVLLLEFEVEIVETLNKALFPISQRQSGPEIAWERDRKIIRWSDDSQGEFGVTLRSLLNKYKAPEAALDYSAGTEEAKHVLDPKSLARDNYVQQMHNFLYKEEHARRKKLPGPRRFTIAMTENFMSSGKGISFNIPGELFAVFELPSYLNRDTDEGFLILDSCKKVLLARAELPDSPVYEVKIEETFVDHIILKFSKTCVEDWNLKTGEILEAEIKFQLDRERFCRCHCALDQLDKQKLLSLVCPKPTSVVRYHNGNSPQEFYSTGLDIDQVEVLKFMATLNSKNVSGSPLFVVQGSFGTGKTYTISKCVMYLLQTNPSAKILICTHSNSAADHYIELNFTNFKEWKEKVVRVNYYGRKPASVSPLVKKYCLRSTDDRGYRHPTAQEIASRRVFITTFETSLELGIKGSGIIGAFTHIFLDEAAQAMEAEAILPLTLANSTKTKIVIAGDHKQISQKIYSIGKFSSLKDTNFTLLERMFSIYYQSTTQKLNLVILRNNYRCVPPILKLIESIFYRNDFLKACSMRPTPIGLKPIQFYNVEGRCLQDPFSSDYYNTAEAYQIAEIVDWLLQSFPMFLLPTDIVVASSYHHQVQVIRSSLRGKGLKDVKVIGVRGIQGLEYKVVILSCVHQSQTKADKEGSNFGLLSDRSLLNTAFTRSMLAVIAVGHAATLLSLGRCSIVWRKYLQTCSEQNGLFPQTTSFEAIKRSAVNMSGLNPVARDFVPGLRKAQPKKISQAEDPPTGDTTSQNLFENEDSDEEETLPLKDDILDNIIKMDTGSSPEILTVKVDRSGREFIEADPDRSAGAQKNLHNEFSLGHLMELCNSRPDEYKRCILNIITWNAAEATVLDDDSDIKKILVKTKKALGRSFHRDEVVVHITAQLQNEIATNEAETPPVYGKVIGILKRYDDLSEKKFICIPDKFSPGLMVPINKNVTKFFALGTRGLKEPGVKIPICELTGKGTGVRIKRYAKYDKDCMTLDNVSHFVVRFVKWPANFTYPFGYVSEEIKPKNVEKYYSEVYDVPPLEPRTNVKKEAKKMSKEQLPSENRWDLTSLFVFTIDPKGSTDLDDALSVQPCTAHNSCWQIGIHIADVASVVTENSKVDSDAKKRATTFYSGDVKNRKVTPMLPKELSAGKCSLLADGNSKPAISLFIHSSCLPNILSPSRNISESSIPMPVLTTIQSRRQMTYKDAEDCLRRAKRYGTNPISTSTEHNLPDQLYIIWQTMLTLRLKRLGGAAFSSRPEFDEMKQFYEETTAHMLIEEAMITCNACTSIFLDKKACTFPLRTQESPVPEESQIWKNNNALFIKRSLYQQSCLSTVCPDQVADVLRLRTSETMLPVLPDVWEQIDLAIERNDLESALVLFCSDAIQPAVSPGISGFLRIQKKAKLLINTDVKELCPDGQVSHFSLRLPFYSHCSSPIRRYTDILTQRLVILKCQQQIELQQQRNVILLEHVGQSGNSDHLKILSKTLEKRMEEAQKYEQDTRKVSFAKNLAEQQRYDIANVVEINESDVFLNFICLRDLPLSCCKLQYSELNLHGQNETTLTWRIKFYDLAAQHQNEDGISHRQLVTTAVTSSEWFRMVSFIRAAYFDENVVGPNREEMKQLFRRVHIRENPRGRCRNRDGDKPCYDEDCKKCDDVFCYPSKLKIKHYRRIKMSLSLGLPLCVQLYCTINRGICTASIQMLSLSQDLDICLAHLRSPIEIFAADVTPHKGRHFQDVKSYERHWLPLFRMEAIYNAIKDSSNALTLQNVEVEFNLRDTEKSGGSFSLDKDFRLKRLIKIFVNDFLCLRIKNLSVSEQPSEKAKPSPEDCFTWIAHAFITEIVHQEDGPNLYWFELCKSQVSQPNLSKVMDGKVLATVEVLQLGMSDRHIARALQKIRKPSLPNVQEITSLCLDQAIPSDQQVLPDVERNGINVGSETIPGMKYKLNEGQIEQIKLALGRNISMIQGPPGTGKSYVGAHLAYYFRELNKKMYKKPGKILYCGPSNRSVDVVAEYLLRSRLKVLRVYGTTYEEQDFPDPLKPVIPRKQNEKRPDTKIADITLHHRIRRDGNSHAARINELYTQFSDPNLSEDELLAAYKSYRLELKKARKEELQKHDVIVCTCATATMLALELEERQDDRKKKENKTKLTFTQCIIDECGMCGEPETLAPIIASQATQVVLIGDHMQLQPIIMCRKAKEFGLGVSMFERLKAHAGMLTNQYRMHSGICKFPSKQFYESSLTTDQSVMEREAGRPFRFCYPATSYENTAIFCQVDGVETVNYSLDRGGENSISNELEARAVVRILAYLHFTMKVKLSDIMILTPYTAQVITIKEMIEKERSTLTSAHVGTVITSQGSESDYVILSTVRSQPKSAIEEDAPLHWRRKFIGFVADPHQINVAITRAKSGLCIVGNKKVLEKDTETWKCLLESYQRRGSIVHLGCPTAPWNAQYRH